VVVDEAGQILLARDRVHPGQVDHRQVKIHRLRHHLHRLAIDEAEGRPQDLVAGDHDGKGALQQGGLQAAANAERLGEIVERCRRIELLEKPEPPLGEGSREHKRILRNSGPAAHSIVDCVLHHGEIIHLPLRQAQL